MCLFCFCFFCFLSFVTGPFVRGPVFSFSPLCGHPPAFLCKEEGDSGHDYRKGQFQEYISSLNRRQCYCQCDESGNECTDADEPYGYLLDYPYDFLFLFPAHGYACSHSSSVGFRTSSSAATISLTITSLPSLSICLTFLMRPLTCTNAPFCSFSAMALPGLSQYATLCHVTSSTASFPFEIAHCVATVRLHKVTFWICCVLTLPIYPASVTSLIHCLDDMVNCFNKVYDGRGSCVPSVGLRRFKVGYYPALNLSNRPRRDGRRQGSQGKIMGVGPRYFPAAGLSCPCHAGSAEYPVSAISLIVLNPVSVSFSIYAGIEGL